MYPPQYFRLLIGNISVSRCAGVLDYGLDCYQERHLDAPYPKCCPSRVCKGDPDFNQTKYDLLGRKWLAH